MSIVHRGPGKYVAICDNTNLDAPYIKEFEIPQVGKWGMAEECYSDTEAGWYFLNRVDFTACIEAVYPAAMFDSLKNNWWDGTPSSAGGILKSVSRYFDEARRLFASQEKKPKWVISYGGGLGPNVWDAEKVIAADTLEEALKEFNKIRNCAWEIDSINLQEEPPMTYYKVYTSTNVDDAMLTSEIEILRKYPKLKPLIDAGLTYCKVQLQEDVESTTIIRR